MQAFRICVFKVSISFSQGNSIRQVSTSDSSVIVRFVLHASATRKCSSSFRRSGSGRSVRDGSLISASTWSSSREITSSALSSQERKIIGSSRASSASTKQRSSLRLTFTDRNCTLCKNRIPVAASASIPPCTPSPNSSAIVAASSAPKSMQSHITNGACSATSPCCTAALCITSAMYFLPLPSLPIRRTFSPRCGYKSAALAS